MTLMSTIFESQTKVSFYGPNINLEHVITGGEESNEKLLLVLLLSAVPDQSIILMRELLAKKFTPHNTWLGASVKRQRQELVFMLLHGDWI